MSSVISTVRRKKEQEQDIYENSDILDNSCLEYRLNALKKSGKSLLAFQEESCRWLTKGKVRILTSDCTINERTEIVMALPDSNDAGTLLVCPPYEKYEWRLEINFWRPDLYVENIKNKKSFSIPIPGEVNLVSWDSLPDSFPSGAYNRFVMVLADVDLAKKITSARARKILNLVGYPDTIIATTIDCYLEKAQDLFSILSVTGAIESLEVDDFLDFKEKYFTKVKRKFIPNLDLKEFMHSIVRKRSAQETCKRYPPIRLEDRFVSINHSESKSVVRKLSKIGGFTKTLEVLNDENKKRGNSKVLSEALELLSSLKWPMLQELINSYIIASEPLIIVTSCESILENLRKNKRWAVITKGTKCENRDLSLSRFKRETLRYMAISHSVMTGLNIELNSPCITVLKVEPDLNPEVNKYIYRKLEKMASRRSSQAVNPIHIINLRAHNKIDALFWENLEEN